MSIDSRVKETDCSCNCNFCATGLHCSIPDNGCYTKGPGSLVDDEDQWGEPSGSPFFVPFDDSE